MFPKEFIKDIGDGFNTIILLAGIGVLLSIVGAIGLVIWLVAVLCQ